MGFLDGYEIYDTSNGYGDPGEWRRAFWNRMDPDEARAILEEDDPYSILGIKRTATKAEIKKAYYKMALAWHPDKNPDIVDKATEMMKKINAAYDLIG